MKFLNILFFVIFAITYANAFAIKNNSKDEKRTKNIFGLLGGIIDSVLYPYNPTDDYLDALKQFDYKNQTTYVIGHKSPDCDTVGSAIAYADLLNKLGIEAKPAVSGPLNSETKYFFEEFKLNSPELLTDATGKQFVLVDHSNYSQAIDGMKSARIVGIVDHHNVGDIITSEIVNARFAPVGATASIIFQMYHEYNIPISKKIARVMVMSILSDTRNLAKATTRSVDKNALKILKKISKINNVDEIFEGMLEAKTSYKGMTDEEIYNSDFKEYEIGGKKICFGNVDAMEEEKARDLAERMYNYMEKSYADSGFDIMFSMVSNKNEDENENKTFIVSYGDGAVELVEKAFGPLGDEKYYVTKEVLSRKTHAIPAITEILSN